MSKLPQITLEYDTLMNEHFIVTMNYCLIGKLKVIGAYVSL